MLARILFIIFLSFELVYYSMQRVLTHLMHCTQRVDGGLDSLQRVVLFFVGVKLVTFMGIVGGGGTLDRIYRHSRAVRLIQSLFAIVVALVCCIHCDGGGLASPRNFWFAGFSILAVYPS